MKPTDQFTQIIKAHLDARAAEKRVLAMDVIAKNAKKYYDKVARYLDIKLEEEDLTIRVIPTLTDMLEEGLAMHHCVFQAGYYNRDDTLILSAMMAGHHAATVEYRVSSGTIMQCRGVNNSKPECYNRVLALIKTNRRLFNLNNNKNGNSKDIGSR